MLCGSRLLPLEEHKAFGNPVNPFSIPNTLPPNQAAQPHPMLKGHLCPLPDRRPLGAESQVPRKQPQTSGGLLLVLPNTPWNSNLSLHLQPWSRKYTGTILWTFTLTATLRLSSFWLSSPMGCIGLWQYAGRISFLYFLEIPRSALTGELFLSQIPEANLSHATLFKHSVPDQSCHDILLPFLYIPAIIYL